ncbi:hypothetical protein [Chryseobacterium sp. CCH4-E10]|uniref:hypothetical protein n=1 Tax=Chryseobacterium sp. CCH4-E10 TaxID=1768758 RepID=UPI00082C3CC9|nr:hypothetical protein [Chryseobacterium sp. CCH4-E10]
MYYLIWQVPPQPGNIENALFYYSKRLQDGSTINPAALNGSSSIYFGKYLENLKWRKLDGFIAKDYNGYTLKQASFNYNNVPTERLKLQSLTVDQQYTHSFEYNNFGSLPGFVSTNVDHFGYYKSTPFVIDFNNPTIHEPSRETDPTKVYYGTLSKITYPLK